MNISEKQANERIGKEKYNKFGSKMKIVGYTDYYNIDLYFEEYDYTGHYRYDQFISGAVKCPYEPRICGVGYFGENKFETKGKDKILYTTWSDMLKRCYNKKLQQRDRNKSYLTKHCSVDESWYNLTTFQKWFNENHYEISGCKMCLDKDILVKGNNIYSPETCCFVPEEINNLFTKTDANRGDCPIGVTYHKRDCVYEAKCCIGKKKAVYLGRFNNSEDAFMAYKKCKEKVIKQMADKYKQYLPERTYQALYNYQVEIND